MTFVFRKIEIDLTQLDHVYKAQVELGGLQSLEQLKLWGSYAEARNED